MSGRYHGKDSPWPRHDAVPGTVDKTISYGYGDLVAVYVGGERVLCHFAHLIEGCRVLVERNVNDPTSGTIVGITPADEDPATNEGAA